MFLLNVFTPAKKTVGKFRITKISTTENLSRQILAAMGLHSGLLCFVVGDLNVGLDEVIQAARAFEASGDKGGFEGLEEHVDFDLKSINITTKTPQFKETVATRKRVLNSATENAGKGANGIEKMRKFANEALVTYCSRIAKLFVVKKIHFMGIHPDAYEFLVEKNFQGPNMPGRDEIVLKSYLFALPSDREKFWEDGFEAAASYVFLKVDGEFSFDVIKKYLRARMYNLNHEWRYGNSHQGRALSAWISRSKTSFLSYEKWMSSFSGYVVTEEIRSMFAAAAELKKLKEPNGPAKKQRGEGSEFRSDGMGQLDAINFSQRGSVGLGDRASEKGQEMLTGWDGSENVHWGSREEEGSLPQSPAPGFFYLTNES